MRIPHVHKLHLEPMENTQERAAEIQVNIQPEAYLDDLGLFEDKSEYIKFIIRLKGMIRNSFEYTELISHLKYKGGMDHCGVHPNLTVHNGFRIELHHTPFCLEDIAHIVINRRLRNGATMKMGDIIHEVMELHYLGLVGLYPLCMLCHGYAHPVGDSSGDDLFIPMADVYGDPEKFWEMYRPYATDSVKTKFENIQILNKGYTIIENQIPQELMRKYLYVKPAGENGKKEEKSLEVISTSKLIDFIKTLNE